jgi:SAM-dependent methyltransferase
MRTKKERELKNDKREPEYHDYVIKDGKFIGKFEEMYENCEDPWHQIKTIPYANKLVLWEISKRKFKNVLDVGCGLGKFTSLIKKNVNCKVTGIDISQIAIKKARKSYPHINFKVVDVMRHRLETEQYDLVIASELFWYVLEKLDFIIKNLVNTLRVDGELIIIQKFYLPGEQKYGNEIISSPFDLIKKLPLKIEKVIETDRFTSPRCIIFGKKQ